MDSIQPHASGTSSAAMPASIQFLSIRNDRTGLGLAGEIGGKWQGFVSSWCDYFQLLHEDALALTMFTFNCYSSTGTITRTKHLSSKVLHPFQRPLTYMTYGICLIV